jgi:hypothetical protein
MLLTLRELEATTSLWTTWLLTLNLTRVASEEAVILEVLLILSVNLNECASDSEAESLALTCETATVEVSLDVILLSYFKKLQRLLNNILQDS